MILRKWNYKKQKYEDFEVNDNWNCKTYSNNMDEIVNCPNCGKKIKYRDTYTSIEIHTAMGFGYHVCEQCYGEEWKKRRSSYMRG